MFAKLNVKRTLAKQRRNYVEIALTKCQRILNNISISSPLGAPFVPDLYIQREINDHTSMKYSMLACIPRSLSTARSTVIRAPGLRFSPTLTDSGQDVNCGALSLTSSTLI